MREIILVASHWAHLIATVIWIGGITFILLIALPSAKQVLGSDAGKLMGEISKRFTPIANYSIIFLLVTGIILTALNKQLSEIESVKNNWTLFLILKHVLVLGMVAVHFYRGLVLAPKIAGTASAEQKASLQRLSLNLVKVNFFLGLLVLFFSGIL
ncbi:MAG: CopD family protein [Nitrospirota bacterium]